MPNWLVQYLGMQLTLSEACIAATVQGTPGWQALQMHCGAAQWHRTGRFDPDVQSWVRGAIGSIAPAAGTDWHSSQAPTAA